MCVVCFCRVALAVFGVLGFEIDTQFSCNDTIILQKSCMYWAYLGT